MWLTLLLNALSSACLLTTVLTGRRYVRTCRHFALRAAQEADNAQQAALGPVDEDESEQTARIPRIYQTDPPEIDPETLYTQGQLHRARGASQGRHRLPNTARTRNV